MIRNMGPADRGLRAALGLALLAGTLLLGWGAGSAWGWALVAVAVVLLATAAVGTCPAYLPFGASTCPRR